jgi:hypothetical protein
MALHRAAAIALTAASLCFSNLCHASSGGALAFQSAAGTTFQNARTNNFPVARTGGSTGTAGAVCTAVSGTAVMGKDFTMVHSSLQWGSGDTALENCAIAIADTTPFSGVKSFTLELTSVTGATVGSLGKQTVSIYGNRGSGAVALSAATYSVAQTVGTLNVTVNRTGGSSGEAIVYYATANATAAAGTDYVPTSGRLYWPGGSSGAQTISIPISSATPFSGSKTFALALSYPEDAVLSTPTSAIVAIVGNDGADGTGSAELSWAPPTTNDNGTPVTSLLTSLTGYHIHYGTSRSAMTQTVAVSGASTTSYELTGLTKATWFFSVSADAEDGTSGPEGAISSKTID